MLPHLPYIPSSEELLALTATYGYPLVFFGFILGGPLVTTGVSFAASLGYFNIYAIIIMSLIAEPAADSTYYWIGRWGRRKIVAWFAEPNSLATPVDKLAALVQQHTIKTIVIAKLTPLAPAPSLMAAGIAKIPYRKFAAICFAVTFPQTMLFVGIGYFFGNTYAHATTTLESGVLTVLLAVVATYIAYHGYRILGAKLFTTSEI